MNPEQQILIAMFGEAQLERFNATVAAAKAQTAVKQLETKLLETETAIEALQAASREASAVKS